MSNPVPVVLFFWQCVCVCVCMCEREREWVRLKCFCAGWVACCLFIIDRPFIWTLCSTLHGGYTSGNSWWQDGGCLSLWWRLTHGLPKAKVRQRGRWRWRGGERRHWELRVLFISVQQTYGSTLARLTLPLLLHLWSCSETRVCCSSRRFTQTGLWTWRGEREGWHLVQPPWLTLTSPLSPHAPLHQTHTPPLHQTHTRPSIRLTRLAGSAPARVASSPRCPVLSPAVSGTTAASQSGSGRPPAWPRSTAARLSQPDLQEALRGRLTRAGQTERERREKRERVRLENRKLMHRQVAQKKENQEKKRAASLIVRQTESKTKRMSRHKRGTSTAV